LPSWPGASASIPAYVKRQHDKTAAGRKCARPSPPEDAQQDARRVDGKLLEGSDACALHRCSRWPRRRRTLTPARARPSSTWPACCQPAPAPRFSRSQRRQRPRRAGAGRAHQRRAAELPASAHDEIGALLARWRGPGRDSHESNASGRARRSKQPASPQGSGEYSSPSSEPKTPLPRCPAVAAQARQAASLIVLRDCAADGFEVLMMRRADRPGDQNSGATVFPGGLLDPATGDTTRAATGWTMSRPARAWACPDNGLHYWVAAVRECFEEAGLLFAADCGGAQFALDARDADGCVALRRALHANQIGMAEVCERAGRAHGAWPPTELAYYSHWITPQGHAQGLRHALLRGPGAGRARPRAHDATETVRAAVADPGAGARQAGGAEADERHRDARSSAWLGFGQAAAGRWIDCARAQTSVPLIRPRLGHDVRRRRAPVAEPRGLGLRRGRPARPRPGAATSAPSSCRAEPVWLSPRVLRVTAPNGSMMTGPGTNAYFIGAPGSDRTGRCSTPARRRRAHLRALKAKPRRARVSASSCTHTHKDHSPAAVALKAHFGARTFGRVADHPEWQDASFRPRPGGERRRALRARRRRHAARCTRRAMPATTCATCWSGEAAVHRRPRHAGQHRGHQPARRRHGGLPRLAARGCWTRTWSGWRPATAS
jgi:8-oxo-dGTP pyrophosphatase MutT (NUDIX family)